MRIWIANHYAVPPRLGGITRHYELGEEWAKEEGAEVTLWLSSFNHSRRQFVDQASKGEKEPVKGFRLRWLWSFPHRRNDIRRMLNMISFAFLFFIAGLFRTRPNVIIASSPHLLTPFSGWLLSRIKGCPFVLEVRDLWPDTLINMGGLKRSWMIKALTWLESFLYRQADKIVVLTGYQRRFIVDKKIDPSKVTLIPNGILRDSWKSCEEKRSAARRRMGVASNQFVALYAGAHGPANALEYVVRAGKELPQDCVIVLIGDGPEKKKLQRICEQENIEQVFFLDPVTKEEIYDFIDAADCGIISLANNEIFRGARPNKLFDYLFVGKPILTTVDGEVRQILEESRTGIFCGAEDPRGIAEGILLLRDLPAVERKAIQERGLQYVDQFGDRQKLAHQFYEDLCFSPVSMNMRRRWRKHRRIMDRGGS
ncbi:Glycosyltransferase involved in cell wall bisynthesis [Marininema mesophilum]|uniref:Glycosyltransferase involved in cell wall bisynthesis n=1 Tax=Marininema mesophilum TaxID=1048340 RepID=A0A1H2TFV8_9BACL|nr:glycosyltransferase family 4 protein [Marininema mesophilum]SDW42853.1 Glycosyltransferase involved in cell wall bisynthesis [Marininema mesophilum]